jgi:Flp pilus assembly protein TadG
MSCTRHEGLRDRGAAAVEMALVLPLLFTMLFGVIDFGRLFNAEIQLSQAAREGARVAALGIGDPVARAVAAAPAAGFGGGGPVTGTATICTPTSPPTDDGIVTVTFRFTFYVLFIPDRDIRQSARMRCGG